MGWLQLSISASAHPERQYEALHCRKAASSPYRPTLHKGRTVVSKLRHAKIQRMTLFSGLIEICRVQPALEPFFSFGPLVIEDGEPGRVVIVPVPDRVLPENAFVREAQTKGRPFGRFIGVVTFPLVAPISKRECVTHEQVVRFGGGNRHGQRRRVCDCTDLNDAIGRVFSHVTCHSNRLPGDDHDSSGPTATLCKPIEFLHQLVRGEQHRPAKPTDSFVDRLTAKRIPQGFCMSCRVERFYAHRAPFDCSYTARRSWCPTRNRGPRIIWVWRVVTVCHPLQIGLSAMAGKNSHVSLLRKGRIQSNAVIRWRTASGGSVRIADSGSEILLQQA